MENFRGAMGELFIICAVVAVLLYIAQRSRQASAAKRSSEAPAPAPGRFVIRGVDRQSKLDTTWHCTADSEANARAKAELEGIVVTAVERE